MTPRENEPGASRRGLRASEMPEIPEELTVQEAQGRYRDLVLNFRIPEYRRLFEADVHWSWFICRIQKQNPAARRRASVLTIAYGLSLQQLGFLGRARECFDRLMSELGLRRDFEGLLSLHSQLGEDLGDHALTLYFRLAPYPLGTDKCGQTLQHALTMLRSDKNKAKFFWRLRCNDILTGHRVDPVAFEQQYLRLAGEEWGIATGNVTQIRFTAILSRAVREQPIQSGLHWDQAVHWSEQAFNTTFTRLARSEAAKGHLLVHTYLLSLSNVVSHHWCRADRRGRKEQALDLAAAWHEIEGLRHDAGIHSMADGFREMNQLNRKLFREEGMGIDRAPRPSDRGDDLIPLERRLQDLIHRIRSYCRIAT